MCHPEAIAYHHHYTALEVQRKQAFEVFKNSHNGLPKVFTNCLVYTCPAADQLRDISKANELIKGLRLPLKAMSATFGQQNTFIVEILEEYKPGEK